MVVRLSTECKAQISTVGVHEQGIGVDVVETVTNPSTLNVAVVYCRLTESISDLRVIAVDAIIRVTVYDAVGHR